MSPSRSSMIARLARWLGPWTDQASRPKVRRARTRLEGKEPFDLWCYRPLRRDPVGALLVLPGLHYLGPADPRFDRFLAVLADCGIAAFCPFLPELRRLSVGPSVVDDALAALDHVRHQHGPVGVFSISFGSYPAIHLAAERPDDVSALTLFGGYARFEDAIRFSLEGAAGHPHDPLNRPVVFLNLVDHLPGVPEDREPLVRAWDLYVRRTWGRPSMKEEVRWRRVAEEIGAQLPDAHQRFFFAGTGSIAGGDEMIATALEAGRHTLTHLDLMEPCRRVRCPVTIVHGRDDDVIPHTHAAMLAEALPAETSPRVLLTGLYGHTAAGMVDVRAIREELRAMVGILEAIVDAARS